MPHLISPVSCRNNVLKRFLSKTALITDGVGEAGADPHTCKH